MESNDRMATRGIGEGPGGLLLREDPSAPRLRAPVGTTGVQAGMKATFIMSMPSANPDASRSPGPFSVKA